MMDRIGATHGSSQASNNQGLLISNGISDVMLNPKSATRLGVPQVSCLNGQPPPGLGTDCSYFGRGSSAQVARESYIFNLPRILSKDLKCDQMVKLPESLFPNEKYAGDNIYGAPPGVPPCQDTGMTQTGRDKRDCTSLTETTLDPYSFFPNAIQGLQQNTYYADSVLSTNVQSREIARQLMSSDLSRMCNSSDLPLSYKSVKSFGFYPTMTLPKYV